MTLLIKTTTPIQGTGFGSRYGVVSVVPAFPRAVASACGTSCHNFYMTFLDDYKIITTFADEMAKRTLEDFYKESKRIREEVLQQAELLKGRPLRFIITNEITMRVEITKTDLKTIVSKNVGDDKFNAIKNALAKDIPGYIAKATYLGWRPIAEGKHFESAYFAYFSRELGCRTILCMRRLADGDIYKPYAIINDHTFATSENELRK